MTVQAIQSFCFVFVDRYRVEKVGEFTSKIKNWSNLDILLERRKNLDNFKILTLYLFRYRLQYRYSTGNHTNPNQYKYNWSGRNWPWSEQIQLCGSESLLSSIPPVLHPSCFASLLFCIPSVMHPSCHASLLSCIPPVMHPSFPTSFLSWIPTFLHPSRPESLSWKVCHFCEQKSKAKERTISRKKILIATFHFNAKKIKQHLKIFLSLHCVFLSLIFVIW